MAPPFLTGNGRQISLFLSRVAQPLFTGAAVCSELYKLYPSPQPLCKGVVNPHFAAEEAMAQRREASCPGRVTEQASTEPGI